jgi:hypothetical protein
MFKRGFFREGRIFFTEFQEEERMKSKPVETQDLAFLQPIINDVNPGSRKTCLCN